MRPPGQGVLDPEVLAQRLYERNLLAAPSAVIRRALHRAAGRLPRGPGRGGLRVLAARARRRRDLLLRAAAGPALPPPRREHVDARRAARRAHAPAAGDELPGPRAGTPTLVPPAQMRRTLAKDLCDLGRYLVEVGPPAEASRALRASFRRQPVRARADLARPAPAGPGGPGARGRRRHGRPAPRPRSGRTAAPRPRRLVGDSPEGQHPRRADGLDFWPSERPSGRSSVGFWLV